MNELATLVGELPAKPLQGKVITSAVSPGDSTMSTLYGNDLAARCARTNLKHDYPSGAVLSLVTWSQREDSRWFGGKIPDQVKSVEFVFVGVAGDGRPSYSYQKYQTTRLHRRSALALGARAARPLRVGSVGIENDAIGGAFRNLAHVIFDADAQ